MDVSVGIFQEKSLGLCPKGDSRSMHGKCCLKFTLKRGGKSIQVLCRQQSTI